MCVGITYIIFWVVKICSRDGGGANGFVCVRVNLDLRHIFDQGVLVGGSQRETRLCVCLGVVLCFLDNFKWSSETAHGDVHGLCCVCVYFYVFGYTSMCLCNCLGINHQSHATSICFLDNLKRSGETTHGDVGGLTACHVEVGTANFAWRFSQKRIREVLLRKSFHPSMHNKYLMWITITEDRHTKYVKQIY